MDEFAVTIEIPRGDNRRLKFPDEFLWGAATAAHQVEGDNRNDWSEWEKSEERIRVLKKRGLIKKYGLANFISGRACDHYHRFREDFNLAKELGHKATRFSIEWSRIEPEEGKFDNEVINHYKGVLETLRELEIEPLVTLWHYTLPIWFRDRGGWLNKESPVYFERYVRRVVSEFGGVKFWITLNEPEIYLSGAYLNGTRPPQKKNVIFYFQAFNNLVKAHRLSFEAIKAIRPEAQVGIAKNNVYFEAVGINPINKLIKAFCDKLWNFYFLDKIARHQDFIGLNYYFHNRINFFFRNENKIVSDFGWELYPEGIYFVLKDLKKYGVPVYITENGLADAEDKNRIRFISETVRCVHRALSDGVDIRGYFHWSLLDNFEWESGFWPRFGLIAVDYKTFERKPRPSAYFYKKICVDNGL